MAAEALYSSLTMKLDDKTLGNMYQIFNHKNPGIAYIDDIEIISDDMVTMRKFMTLLPRDQIEVLKYVQQINLKCLALLTSPDSFLQMWTITQS